MQIWKFPFDVTADVSVEMPFGAKVLTVQVQNGIPCLWALVEPRNTMPKTSDGTTKFRIVGTGHEFDGQGEYVGTFQLMDGALVFHVFEVSQ